jgi:uracil-DNA glycosylase
MLNKDWLDILNTSCLKDQFNEILNNVNKIYCEKDIYPQKENIFKALNITSFKNVKVVIIGQDPYHGDGEANGLAFSLNENVKITPSLRNIFKELENDLNIKRTSKDLSGWAKQGVLLLNTILTVEKDKPLSHKDLGWEKITDYLIKYISDNKENVVFILWGNYAKAKKKIIDENKHLIIESNHPSPLSASKGFFGSKPFSKTNNYLIKNNQSVIDWSL